MIRPLPVRGSFTGIADREHPGFSIQRVNFYSGIVGDGNQVGSFGIGYGLDGGILLKCLAGLFDLDLYAFPGRSGKLPGFAGDQKG